MTTLEQAARQAPVAAQCRFEGEAEWRHCTVAHHLHVQAHPKEWPHYETRALYTHPPVIDKSAAIRIATALGWEPKKEWVGLTDEERDSITRSIQGGYGSDTKVARAVEAKLKEKNT